MAGEPDVGEGRVRDEFRKDFGCCAERQWVPEGLLSWSDLV